jgi:hypothetical protein
LLVGRLFAFRLRGFHSLEPVTMGRESGGLAKPTKLGALVLDAGGEDAGAVEFRDARGGVLQRVELAAYSTGEATRRAATRRGSTTPRAPRGKSIARPD